MDTEVTNAETEARAARDAHANLQGRLTSGDLSVTQDELNEAERNANFLTLRAQGARAKAEQEAEADREQRVEALRAEGRTVLAKRSAELHKAVNDAVSALAALGNETASFNEAHGTLNARKHDLRPADLPVDKPLPPRLARLFDFGAPLKDFSPVRLALAAIGEALQDSPSLVLPGDAQTVREYGRGPVHEELRLLTEIADWLNRPNEGA